VSADDRRYELPRWRVTGWLADPGKDVPDEIRLELTSRLFGTLPVFAGGVINTLLVSAAAAARVQTISFIAWAVLELAVCMARLAVLVLARRAALEHRRTLTDLHVLLALCWSGSVGFGVFISLLSGDWVVATLACLSAAAMVGGICFRNFSAPRLATSMIVLSLGPLLLATGIAGQPLLYVVFLQGPLYVFAMSTAAFKLNSMLIATLRAERRSDYRATHDALTGLLNRSGLAGTFERWQTKPGSSTTVAMLFIDLDDFKQVNDTHGHAVGDKLLQQLAGRLADLLPKGGLAARIGGDEFVVLLRAISAEETEELAQHLTDALSAFYDIAGEQPLGIGVSVGAAVTEGVGISLEDLLARSDKALYAAKLARKGKPTVPSIEDGIRDLWDILERIPEAPLAKAS
jgi:diguanylate cyclase (GGDEF)-like protein